jgi:transcriptional regulator with XRE-family HTH domain
MRRYHTGILAIMTRAATKLPKASHEVDGDDHDRFVRHQMLALGKVVRNARRGRYSLEDLAARSGVSAGLISQVERGLGNPSFVTISKLAAALDTPLAEFYQGPSHEGELLVKKSERRRLDFPDEGLTYELLTPDFRTAPFLLKCRIPRGYDNEGSATKQHPGRKAILVLAGCLEVMVDGRDYTLNEGDTITFAASLPNNFKNPGPGAVDAIFVIDRPDL